MATQDDAAVAANWDRERELDRNEEREAANRFLRHDYRHWRRIAPRPATNSVLDLLAHAGEALDEARALACAAGLDVTQQVIQRSAVLVASAIETIVQPLDVQPLAAGGVLQGPVPSYPVPTTGGGR